MGSAFGRVGQSRPQPSNEMYENVVALEWRLADASRPLWVEHEGRHVGSCLVPDRMYAELRAPELLCVLNVPREARVRHLVRMYCSGEGEVGEGGEAGGEAAGEAGGDGDAAAPPTMVEQLSAAVESLRKRRGGAATDEAHAQLRRREFAAVADAALEYYDALYDDYAASSGCRTRLEFSCEEAPGGDDADAQARALLAAVAAAAGEQHAPATA